MKKILFTILVSFAFSQGFTQARVLLGQNGKVIQDTVRKLNVVAPLYKINDSTISSSAVSLWKQSAANTIYHDSGTVTIYNDTANVTNGSSALILKNRTAATVSVPVSAAAFSFFGNTWVSSGGGMSVPTEWRIIPVAALGTAGNLDFRSFLNGVIGAQVLTLNGTTGTATYNTMTGANFTASGISTLNAVNISGVTTIGHTFFGGYTTYDNLLLSPNYTITSGGSATKGFYNAIGIKQTATGLNNSKLGGFSNNIGENRFTTSGLDRSGFGITDSVNGSAVLEIRTATSTGLVGGLLLPRVTKAQRNNIISSLTGTISGGTGNTLGFKSYWPLTGGSGTGATADISNSGGVINYVWIRDIGSGYKVGDVLSASGLGGTGFTYTLTTVGAPADGLSVIVTGEIGGSYLSWYNASTSGWVKATSTSD